MQPKRFLFCYLSRQNLTNKTYCTFTLFRLVPDHQLMQGSSKPSALSSRLPLEELGPNSRVYFYNLCVLTASSIFFFLPTDPQFASDAPPSRAFHAACSPRCSKVSTEVRAFHFRNGTACTTLKEIALKFPYDRPNKVLELQMAFLLPVMKLIESFFFFFYNSRRETSNVHFVGLS